MSNKPYRIGLVGFGNIGTGVVRQILTHGELIGKRINQKVELAAIADRSFDNPRAVTPPAGTRLTTNWREITSDPDIDVVIELVGVGADGKPSLANEIAREALGSGKDFVTANKALIATHGTALQEIADKNGALLLYESSVGAGIPIIASMQGGLASSQITAVHGILNGTCNYIFARMGEDPTLTLDGAIQEAQELGYAEPDPSADVEGTDTAYKIAILSTLAFAREIRVEDFPVDGIMNIGPEDVEYANDYNMTIKLLGYARQYPSGQVQVGVGPFFIPADHILASVRGVMNGVLITGDPIGETMYYGAGAGQPSTASGLLSDVMRSAAHRQGRTPLLPLKLLKPDGATPLGEVVKESRYLRIPLGMDDDRADKAEDFIGGNKVRSLENSTTFVTEPITDDDLEELLAKIEGLGVTLSQVTCIRYAFVSG
ncbi:MAG: homoserine dehydrogenase [Candidatus Sumerlaeia bacterium]|nr:homoserine dehydrogenase [Candidatus Sumerlaeia bacterium]